MRSGQATRADDTERRAAPHRHAGSHGQQQHAFTGEDGRIALVPARYRLLCELVGATRSPFHWCSGDSTGRGVCSGAQRHDAVRLACASIGPRTLESSRATPYLPVGADTGARAS